MVISVFNVNEYLINRRVQTEARPINSHGIYLWDTDQIEGIQHHIECIFLHNKEVVYYLECYHNGYYVCFDFFRNNFHIFFNDTINTQYRYIDYQCDISDIDKLDKIMPNRLNDKKFMEFLKKALTKYKEAFEVLKNDLVYSQGI